MNPLPRWRIAAGCLVLAGILFFLVLFTPIYFRNLELQNFVGGITHRVENQAKPDAVLRSQVLERAHQLSLPVTEDNVHVIRSGEELRIDVRYVVRVTLPLYTVDLHFYPGAGSR
ncbi:MAG TPA: hypothetical protein VLY04_24210 [Bryobacteraceae bacterium]|nr:hypothetical protein [Bryobacteraceae bacterium]